MTHRRSPHYAAVTAAKIRKRAARHKATNAAAARHRQWRWEQDMRLQRAIRVDACREAFLDAGGDPECAFLGAMGGVISHSIEEAQAEGRRLAERHPKPKPFRIPTWWDLRRKA